MLKPKYPLQPILYRYLASYYKLMYLCTLLGLAPRAQSENSKDLSITGIAEQLDVFTKNQFNLVGSVRCRGVANRPVAVRLYLKNRSKGTDGA